MLLVRILNFFTKSTMTNAVVVMISQHPAVVDPKPNTVNLYWKANNAK